MKNAVFFFDTFLLQKKDDFYGMTLTYEFLKERYLKYYKTLTVSTRVKDITEDKGNHSGYKIVNGKNIDVIPVQHYKKIPDGILKKKIIQKEIEKILDGKDIAIIRMPSMIGNIACEVCEKKGIKYLIEMVACAWDGYMNHHNKMGKIVAPYMYFRTKKNIKKAKNVLYVTNKFLQKRYPTHGNDISCSDVVINPINKKEIKERKERYKNFDDIKEIKVATVANVGLKYKGQEYVIKAMNLSNNKKIKYYLIGNGNTEYLDKFIKEYGLEDKVVFMGSIPHKEIFNVLKEMDIYIQPSLQEGMPRALLEAMSIGIPCYGSTAGGIPELLNDKYLFKKKDFKAIASIFDRINKKELEENIDCVISKIIEYDPKLLDKKRCKFYKGDLK